jgi:uncharacterized membrane protein YkvA (DUF1232 family)
MPNIEALRQIRLPRLTWRQKKKAEEDRRIVESGFWTKLLKVATHLPFAEELLAAYYCACDGTTPAYVRATLFGALAYFVMPFDVIPDVLPLIGFTDDAAVLTAAIRAIATNMQPEHWQAARDRLNEIRSRA